MSFQVRVLNSRFTAGDQRISHAQDDETSTLAGIEDAGAVLEPAGFGTEFANLISSAGSCSSEIGTLTDAASSLLSAPVIDHPAPASMCHSSQLAAGAPEKSTAKSTDREPSRMSLIWWFGNAPCVVWSLTGT